MRTVIGVMIAAVLLTGCGAQQADKPTATDDQGSLTIMAGNVERAIAGKQTAKVSYSIISVSQIIEGAGELRFGADAAMDVTTTDGDGEIRAMRLAGGVLYTKDAPREDRSVPWYKIDTSRDDDTAKAVAAGIKQLNAMTEPTQLLKQIQAAGTLRETDRGGDSTRYAVQVDVAKLASMPGFDVVAAEMTTAGLEAFTMELWIGKDNLLNQIASHVKCTKPNTTCGVEQEIHFSDWGTPVTITAPPADEVREYPR